MTNSTRTHHSPTEPTGPATRDELVAVLTALANDTTGRYPVNPDFPEEGTDWRPVVPSMSTVAAAHALLARETA